MKSPLPLQDQPDLDCRPLYRTLAASVCVITGRGESGPVGMTASSVTAVSLAPPLLAVTLAPTSPTLGALRKTGQFVVNVLADDQRALSARFGGGRPGWARFSGISLPVAEPPRLADALAHALCSVEWERCCGDRVLVIGRVRRSEVSDRTPLLWHRSGYHALRPLPSGALG
ncbi:MAG: flavin reductase family protein [Microlunatus sp.]|nr:flavin reductase family protein [Microlunatus sp.]